MVGLYLTFWVLFFLITVFWAFYLVWRDLWVTAGMVVLGSNLIWLLSLTVDGVGRAPEVMSIVMASWPLGVVAFLIGFIRLELTVTRIDHALSTGESAERLHDAASSPAEIRDNA